MNLGTSQVAEQPDELPPSPQYPVATDYSTINVLQDTPLTIPTAEPQLQAPEQDPSKTNHRYYLRTRLNPPIDDTTTFGFTSPETPSVRPGSNDQHYPISTSKRCRPPPRPSSFPPSPPDDLYASSDSGEEEEDSVETYEEGPKSKRRRVRAAAAHLQDQRWCLNRGRRSPAPSPSPPPGSLEGGALEDASMVVAEVPPVAPKEPCMPVSPPLTSGSASSASFASSARTLNCPANDKGKSPPIPAHSEHPPHTAPSRSTKGPTFKFHEKELDIFFEYFYGRHEITYKRHILGLPPPWTTNPILSKWFFCEHDRTRDYTSRLMKETLEPLASRLRLSRTNETSSSETLDNTKSGQERSSEDESNAGPLLLFNIIVHRVFSRPETTRHLGVISSIRHVERVWTFLERELNISMRTNAFQASDSRKQLMDAFKLIWSTRAGLWNRIWRGGRGTSRDAYKALLDQKRMGHFRSWQIAMDLVMFGLVELDESFVALGPGAKAGMLLLLKSVDGKPPRKKMSMKNKGKMRFGSFDSVLEQAFWVLLDEARIRIRAMGIPEEFQLTLVSLEHVLCEYQKYRRVKKGQNARRYLGPRAGDVAPARMVPVATRAEKVDADNALVSDLAGLAEPKAAGIVVDETDMVGSGVDSMGDEFVSTCGDESRNWDFTEPEAAGMVADKTDTVGSESNLMDVESGSVIDDETSNGNVPEPDSATLVVESLPAATFVDDTSDVGVLDRSLTDEEPATRFVEETDKEDPALITGDDMSEDESWAPDLSDCEDNESVVGEIISISSWDSDMTWAPDSSPSLSPFTRSSPSCSPAMTEVMMAERGTETLPRSVHNDPVIIIDDDGPVTSDPARCRGNESRRPEGPPATVEEDQTSQRMADGYGSSPGVETTMVDDRAEEHVTVERISGDCNSNGNNQKHRDIE
ncbi:hypothetical protein HK102_003874, partial [Quaeritorhiza haematococci]